MGDLVRPEWRRRVSPPDVPNAPRYGDPLNELLYRDLTQSNLPMLLQNGDRISMAFSVESRLPFLDYRLVEFSAGLPYHFKIRAGESKLLLRRAMAGRLPEAVVNRQDKKGKDHKYCLEHISQAYR